MDGSIKNFTLEEAILDDFKKALKDKNPIKISTLSFLRSELKNTAIAKRKKMLDDIEAEEVIKIQIEQHGDAIKQFRAGNRKDLVNKETQELEILKSYFTLIPALLIKRLGHYDANVRFKAAEDLDRIGWNPENDTEKIRYFIAKRDWENIITLGVQAIVPLTRMLNDEDMGKIAAAALENIYPQIATVSFGEVSDDESKTTWHNPDLSKLDIPLKNLVRVMIATSTHDFHQVERFATYAVNYIGRDHLKRNVEVHIYGNPEKLHGNLRNLFEDLFKAVRFNK